MNKIFLVLILVFIQKLIGQNPYYNTIDKSQGLLTNSVYDIFEDKDNFMWFATDKGLCQFNGYTFQYFSQDGMTSKAGSCIKQDAFGRIWYENFDGYLYYVEKNQLKKLNQNKSIGYFKYGIIQNQLYIINKNTVDIYDLKTLSLIKKIELNTEDNKYIFFSDNTIYVFANQLIVIHDDHIQQKIDLPKDFSENFNSILVEKTKNGLLIGSKFSNYCYLFSNNQFIKKELNLENTIVQNLSWCNNKNWLCTTTGIIEMDYELGTKRTFFDGTNISYIYKTKNNNYWISTLTEGLFYIEDFDTQLISSQESLTTLCFKNEQLIVGTKNDKILALKKKQFKTIFTGKDNHQMGQVFYDKLSNQLYFTSSKFGVLNSELKLTKELPIAVKSVCAVDHKYIAFAASSSSGLIKTNENSKSEWDLVYKAFIELKNLNYNNIVINAKGKSTAFDSINKTIYFATNNGLFYIGQNGLLSELKYKNTSLNITKLSYEKGKIYACNGDLNLYQINKNIISEINFPTIIQKDNVEKTILKDRLLFIITNKYIFEYDLSSKKLKQIIHINSNIEVNDIIIKNNCYYISTNRGLIIRNQEVYNRSNPTFVIKHITVNNQVIKKFKLNDLSYNENNIHIIYRFLSPTPFEEHELLYKINESQWQKADVLNPELVLNSLNHGSYTIEFVLNSDFKNTTKIHFKINRPFWLQFPFIFGASLTILALLYWLYRSNIKKIQKRNQLILDKINLEKNVNQTKLKAIKSQMNPHFFYNALNTLQSYILSNEKKEAVEYLSKFSNLTRTILEMTEKDWITISDEIKTLALYLDIEKARFEGDLTYTITIDPSIDTELIKIPSMLIQPYVENAIKHGLLHKKEEKILTIEFLKIENNLIIKIDDNGIGRVKSNALNKIKNKNHQSFATDALQNRISLLNQYTNKNISIETIDKYTITKQASGTTVIIKLPLE
ncbi:Two-component system sensor histidine kinase [Flavobacterium indicum GPTSA100-9 = DSM 17447]|uniref:Two-component system sensor histidine kinase n=1 Tax=Flavobacterium indicum (strain DSM 17447 / CIP 109464 / GPTSA100-9) TaxID=1094466 RepID=H8XSC3_FLAIG|nr:histidine kinase [Flavobacterium indicum]CCG52508.1 Two-component system sensor histidine kinase [Flavobacterium indicum GPTSA100-9 = DSM 17447]